MITDDELRELEECANKNTWSPEYYRDIPRLIAEVRRLRASMNEQTDAAKAITIAYGSVRKAASAWKRSAKRHRLVLETRWIESCVALKTEAITRERDSLQCAINEFCRASNSGNLTSYDQAKDKLYELARRSGFVDRYTAESVEESRYPMWRYENGLTKERETK